MVAMQLYLKGGAPSKAAALVTSQNIVHDKALLEKIANSLQRNGLFEQAGTFLDHLNMPLKALEAYCKGHAYEKAVELSRRASVGNAVQLEKEWFVSALRLLRTVFCS